MAAITKNSKTNKIVIFFQNGWVYLAETLCEVLVGA